MCSVCTLYTEVSYMIEQNNLVSTSFWNKLRAASVILPTLINTCEVDKIIETPFSFCCFFKDCWASHPLSFLKLPEKKDISSVSSKVCIPMDVSLHVYWCDCKVFDPVKIHHRLYLKMKVWMFICRPRSPCSIIIEHVSHKSTLSLWDDDLFFPHQQSKVCWTLLNYERSRFPTGSNSEKKTDVFAFDGWLLRKIHFDFTQIQTFIFVYFYLFVCFRMRFGV